MAAKKAKHGKGSGPLLLTVALGAALAAAAGYYSQHKEEVDREAKRHYERMAKLYKQNRPMVEKRVREVWGVVSDEAVATYMDVRGMILHALEEEQLEKTGRMVKKHYNEIVETCVKQARKSGVLDKEVEKKLEAMLKMDWQEMRDVLAKSAKKAAMTAQKEVEKALKKSGKRAAPKRTRARNRPPAKNRAAKTKGASPKKTAAKRTRKPAASSSRKATTKRAPAKKSAKKKR